MLTIQKLLRQYRSEIKGFAILWVVFFHAQLGLDGWLYQLQRIGYGGVDIFFFMSGFGLYHSLEKDRDLGRYLKRRAQRILPSYLPFCLVWLAVMLPLYGGGLTKLIRMAVGNLMMIGSLSNAPLTINWYISAMAVSLLLAPALHVILREGKRYWIRVAAVLASAVFAGFAFVDQRQYIAVSRAPLFILGMVFAGRDAGKIQGKKVAAGLALGMLAGTVVLYACLQRYTELLLPYGMYWHPFVMIVPGLCAGLGWLFARLSGRLLTPLRFLGQASFEIFLFNVWVEMLGKQYNLCHTPAEWALWSIVSIALGCIYHWLTGRIRRQKSKL